MFRSRNRLTQKLRQRAAARLERSPLSSCIARCTRIFHSGSGETMLEFAFVAPMVILLLLMIIDLGIMLMTQSLLDGAARDAARLVRTGQVASAGASGVTTFQNQLCADMSPIMSTANCQSNVIFNVQTFASFGTVSFASCNQNSNGVGNGTPCPFNGGNGTQIVGVQVTYNRAYIVPWVDACLTTGRCWFGAASRGGPGGASNTVPLVSTVVFQNEPFPTPSS